MSAAARGELENGTRGRARGVRRACIGERVKEHFEKPHTRLMLIVLVRRRVYNSGNPRNPRVPNASFRSIGHQSY